MKRSGEGGYVNHRAERVAVRKRDQRRPASQRRITAFCAAQAGGVYQWIDDAVDPGKRPAPPAVFDAELSPYGRRRFDAQESRDYVTSLAAAPTVDDGHPLSIVQGLSRLLFGGGENA